MLRTFTLAAIAIAILALFTHSALYASLHSPAAQLGTLPAAQIDGGPAAGDVLLSTSPGEDLVPSVACNNIDHECLVTWVGDDTLVGQRIDAQGVPIDDRFEIAAVGTAGDWSWGPRVAFAVAARRYLVVWDDRADGDGDIFGQLIERDGRPVYDRLVIFDGPGNQQRPSVGASYTDFLVAWDGNLDDDSMDIAGRRVDDNGILGEVHAIAGEGGAPYSDSSVAWEPHSAEFLVVCQYGDGQVAEVRARRIESGAPVGDEFAVSAGGMSLEPDVVQGSDGDNLVWFVVWTGNRGTDRGVYGRFVHSRADAAFGGGELTLHTSDLSLWRPHVAWFLDANRPTVVWEQGGASGAPLVDLMAQSLDMQGKPIDEPFEVGAVASERWFAAVGTIDEPEQLLVVWEDRRTSDINIVAQRLDPSGSRLWYESTVSAASGAQVAPAVAFDPEDGQYLAVWEDQVADGVNIVAVRLDSAGLPTEGPWTIHADRHDNVEPAVAYNAGARSYVVLWADTSSGVLEGSRVFPGGRQLVPLALPGGTGGRRPQLAYNASNDRFLAVWDAHGDVFAQQLEWDGLPIGRDSTSVAVGVTTQDGPVVAVDTKRSRYLVVWRGGTGGAEDLYARILDDAAQPVGDPVLAAGGGSDSMARHGTSVAYDARSDSFLVVYVCDVQSKEGDIRAVQLYGSNAAAGPEVVVRDMPERADQYGPQVTNVAATGRHQVVWTERWASPTGDATGSDLFGRWLEPTGAAVGAVLPVFRFPGDQRGARVAYDAGSGQALLVWQDNRRSKAEDIHSRLGTVDVDPPIARFVVEPTVGKVGTTFTFDARASRDAATPAGALSVRWDWSSDGHYDTQWSPSKTITRTVVAAGTFTVTLEVRDAAGLAATAAHPVRVIAASPNHAPEARIVVTPTLGVAGTNFRFDASASSDDETPSAALEVRWDWENDGEFDTDWQTARQAQREFTTSGPGHVLVEVRDETGLTDTAVAHFRLTPGPTVRLAIDPGTARLATGESMRFRASTWDEYGNGLSQAHVTWTVTDARAGVIDATGVFTAGMRTGDYADVVRASDGSASDAASITVVEPEGPEPTPSFTPTAWASRSPTAGPSPTPTRTPTRGPSPTPTHGPSPTPTRTATGGPSPTPTLGPSATPRRIPTHGPSPTPTRTPTRGPSPTATRLASVEPSPTTEPDVAARIYLPAAHHGGSE